jgi:hypothetical protein
MIELESIFAIFNTFGGRDKSSRGFEPRSLYMSSIIGNSGYDSGYDVESKMFEV